MGHLRVIGTVRYIQVVKHGGFKRRIVLSVDVIALLLGALGHIELSQKGNQKIYRINKGSVSALTSLGRVPTNLSDPVTSGGTDLVLLIIS